MTQFDQRYQQVENQYNADEIHIHQQPLSLTEKQRKQNRTRMLDRVQTIWIEGVLESSIQGAAQIALELQYKPSAVVTPMWHVLREFSKTGPLPPADASIVQVYDHASGEVLILGEPGAGKTTLLLELARDLLERARQEETHPMPVVFNLSSWAATRHPLSDWLVTELHTKYQVPHALAESWIETDQVLPLLDGLDEVAAHHRVACVEAINAYRQAHGLLPTVVCSRQDEYRALPLRLLLRSAVVVQPLTQEQIEAYLTSGGEQLSPLRRALCEDADLQALASTPLMLNVLTTVYQGTAPKETAATGTPGMKQEQVFAAYVQRMLARRSTTIRYTYKQTAHWLSWLAWQMKQRNQTEFYIESMQQDWLPENRSRRLYNDIVGRLISGVVNGLSMGLAFGLGIGLVFGSGFGLVAGLIVGLFSGLLGRPSFGLETKIKPVEVVVWSWLSIRQSMGKYLAAGLPFGLVTWLIVGLLFGILTGPAIGLSTGLLTGLLGSLWGGLWGGGDAWIKHITLRLFLWRIGYVPLHYSSFLDYAAERILLRKVGGGYIFLHRLLLDYFANLESGPDADATGENKQESLPYDGTSPTIREPTKGDEHSDVPTTPLAPAPLFSEVPRQLPCGHEQRTPTARFCSVCGAPIPLSSLE